MNVNGFGRPFSVLIEDFDVFAPVFEEGGASQSGEAIVNWPIGLAIFRDRMP